MKEGFINFSRLKLMEAPENPVAVEKQGSETASVGGQTQREGTNRRREAQGLQMAAKTGSPTQATTIQKNVAERFAQIQQEKETARLLESQKSDWRKEITESLEDDPMEPEHPYVKVMPNIRYKQIEAEKELAAAAGKNGAKQGIKEEKEKKKDSAYERQARALGDQMAKHGSDVTNYGKTSRKHGEAAKKHRKDAEKHEKKGDAKKALASHKKSSSEQKKAIAAGKKARAAAGKESSMLPYASSTYSRKDDPGYLSDKFESDYKSRKGRTEIAKRTLPRITD